MSGWRRGPSEEASATAGDTPLQRPIAGDRGIPSLEGARSVQSRVSRLLAVSFMSVLGAGLLTWYYARTLSHPGQVRRNAQTAVKAKAQGEMTLPPLGPIPMPRLEKNPASSPPVPAPDPGAAERLLGPAPPLSPAGAVPVEPSIPAAAGSKPKSRAALALERRLNGPAFARSASDDRMAAVSAPMSPQGLMAAGAHPSAGEGSAGEAGLGALLNPTVTPAVSAAVLPTRRLLLAKGTFIDCTLETAIDSTLPGLTTCITATDTFSADGSVVLLERGTKLLGETRGEVQQGSSRLFVLWTEGRTPTGVVVPLSSPGTDELGRSGLAGEVNRHFWDRFGAAILLSVVNGAVQGAVNSQNRSGSVVVSPSTSSDVITEVLRGTIHIPPTVTKAQGDRIQVLVARDVDFSSVYALRVTHAAVPGTSAP